MRLEAIQHPSGSGRSLNFTGSRHCPSLAEYSTLSDNPTSKSSRPMPELNWTGPGMGLPDPVAGWRTISSEMSNKLAFVFPGQGSQAVGMGRDLVDHFPLAAQTFAEADEALGFHISKLCFESPEEDLRLTENTQPAILTDRKSTRLNSSHLGI